MDQIAKQKRIAELEEQLEYHDRKYWDEEDPEIPDELYDAMERELKQLDPNNKHFKVVPATARSKAKIKIPVPMMSLDKVYTIPELLEWCSKVSRSQNEKFRIEPKLDGCSSSYGPKPWLATRGKSEDPYVGENITDKVPFISLETKEYVGPLKDFPRDARGEILIKKSVFQDNFDKIVRKNGERYKTPRSATSGILNSNEISSTLGSLLTFVDYNLYSIVVPLDVLMDTDWETFIHDVKEWDYPIDGLVIKLDDDEYSASLGFTSHHPRGQIALKFENPFAETTLTDIIISQGKGKLTPVGLIKPVIIRDNEIRRVSLHNAKFILDHDLQIGDTVIVERAGEIIPHVIKVIPGENRRPFVIDSCPSCGSSLIYDEPELRCSDPDCSGAFQRRLADSVKRIGIENLGESTVEKLIDYGVRNLVDIFNLTVGDILELEGFAQTSAKNLYTDIQTIRLNQVLDWRILAALNIPGIGRTFSKKLLAEITLPELTQFTHWHEFLRFPNVGDERAMALHRGLNDNREYLETLLSILTVETTKRSTAAKGSVCFTGKGDHSREYYTELAEKSGFIVETTTTTTLTYLVCADPSSTSGKMQKARKYGTKVVSYQDFINLLRE